MDIQPNTYAGLRELALFAGAGGGIQASRMLGWHTVCAVEWDDYASNALVSRQNHESALEAFPIWADVQTFDGHPWRGLVDVVSGGFPCQDISAAGIKCIGNGQVPHCAATAFVILADRLESING
ncbi:MAG: DNA cytosine methyltransferase [Candidatus Cloacimonetes bacterium]|nr:DNA cytosine methyltransferase [Candidatus Cloacimonadota bacterium]